MRVVFNHHVARLANGFGIDHDIARDAQANPAASPRAVQALQFWRWRAVAPGQGLGHGRFKKAIFDLATVGQRERLGEGGLGSHERLNNTFEC